MKRSSVTNAELGMRLKKIKMQRKEFAEIIKNKPASMYVNWRESIPLWAVRALELLEENKKIISEIEKYNKS